MEGMGGANVGIEGANVRMEGMGGAKVGMEGAKPVSTDGVGCGLTAMLKVGDSRDDVDEWVWPVYLPVDVFGTRDAEECII